MGVVLRLLCLPLSLKCVIDFLRHRHLSRRLHYKYGFEIFFIYILSFNWLLFLTWGCPWQFKRFLFTFYLFNDSYLVGVRASSLTIYGKERKPELSKSIAKQIGRKTETLKATTLKEVVIWYMSLNDEDKILVIKSLQENQAFPFKDFFNQF